MRIIAVIALLLLGAAALFIRSADNSDARATTGITLLIVDLILWAIVWIMPL